MIAPAEVGRDRPHGQRAVEVPPPINIARTYPGTLGPNGGFGVVLLQELMVRDTRSSPSTYCLAPSDSCC